MLNLNDNIESFINVDVEATKKRFFCVNTDKYDYLCNSAGQDNLGQILTAVLSFKRLKSSLTPWPGGLLLIDEVDATLHPSAQNKLFDLLFEMSRELDIQIIFTTHSLSLLSYIYSRIESNSEYRTNVNIIYLTTANIELEVITNPHWDVIYNDMQITSLFDNNEKISVYTEDAEAIWFLKKL
ncbi:ATP-binding protein [Thermoclostridium stercorarium]|nr:ATP-binding protein [Thermoclostridium stercorarium]